MGGDVGAVSILEGGKAGPVRRVGLEPRTRRLPCTLATSPGLPPATGPSPRPAPGLASRRALVPSSPPPPPSHTTPPWAATAAPPSPPGRRAAPPSSPDRQARSQ